MKFFPAMSIMRIYSVMTEIPQLFYITVKIKLNMLLVLIATKSKTKTFAPLAVSVE